MICSIAKCGQVIHGKNLCARHYMQYWRRLHGANIYPPGTPWHKRQRPGIKQHQKRKLKMLAERLKEKLAKEA